jgi:hypothetical protein
MNERDKAAAEGAEFIVKLEGVQLPAEARTALAKEIQGLTLRELAKINLDTGVGFRIPRKDWLGIWIERFGQGEIPVLKVTKSR